MSKTQIAGLLAIPLLLAAASAQAASGPTQEKLKANYVTSCIPSARESTKGQNVTEEQIVAYCNCSSLFIDDLPDDLLADLVNTETKGQNPSPEIMKLLLAKAQVCRPKRN